jgi:hypothetical protein
VSQYIRILNMIRKNTARLSLTKSQADCRIAILERLEYPGIVNLFGPHGSGKTFLGWCLANEERTRYIVEPSQIVAVERATHIVVIDNAGHHRSDYRRILGDLESARINRAVVVTLERIEDSVQAFELHCTPEDIHTACDNMTQLGHPIEADLPVDLWDMLQRTARRD